MERVNLLEADFTKEVFLELMPEWTDCSDIQISILSGGITNNKTELFINRDYEAKSMKIAATIGISPRLVKYLPQFHVTIIDFITYGYTLKNPDFVRKELREKIVNPIRRLHASGVRLPKVFNPHDEVFKMFDILKSLNVEYPEFDIDGTVRALDKLYEKINIPEDQFAPCHNDLLAENFILVKEGYEDMYNEPLYIIDWEYAGMAPAHYDVADMFQEILVEREIEKSFVEHYCEGRKFEKNLYLIDMFKPFPDIYWFLWSLIQQNISKIEFDFYNYGKTKYENAQNNLKRLKDDYGITL